MLAHARSEHLGDVPTGLGAARVHDTAARVPALARETVVELDTERDELGDALRRLARQQPDRRLPAQPAAGGERVGGVEDRLVVGTDGRGDAALRGPAVGRVDRALREEENGATRVSRGQGGGQPGDPCSHDRHVRVQFLPQRR